MQRFRAVVAVVLAVAASPLLVRHACGLSSWPIEWALILASATTSFALVLKARNKWLAWILTGILPVVSLGLSLAYGSWLHSDAFPEALLDDSGREWRHQTHGRIQYP
jgi:hypothetical protein